MPVTARVLVDLDFSRFSSASIVDRDLTWEPFRQAKDHSPLAITPVRCFGNDGAEVWSMSVTNRMQRPTPELTEVPPRDLRMDEAHSARIYDYILGGKDNYAVDRAASGKMLDAWPALRWSMRANRAFMHRAVGYLAREAGIRQFLDIGTGIPTSPNLHEVVQQCSPESRIVYVDNDPIVLTHARALLTSSPEGRTAYVDADMRDPETILDSPEVAATFDLTEPIGLTVIAIVHFLDDESVSTLINRFMRELPAGSYLALTTATADNAPEMNDVARVYQEEGIDLRLRPQERVAEFFGGLELVEPGVRLVNHWRPELDTSTSFADQDVAMYGGVARKP